MGWAASARIDLERGFLPVIPAMRRRHRSRPTARGRRLEGMLVLAGAMVLTGCSTPRERYAGKFNPALFFDGRVVAEGRVYGAGVLPLAAIHLDLEGKATGGKSCVIHEKTFINGRPAGEVSYEMRQVDEDQWEVVADNMPDHGTGVRRGNEIVWHYPLAQRGQRGRVWRFQAEDRMIQVSESLVRQRTIFRKSGVMVGCYRGTIRRRD